MELENIRKQLMSWIEKGKFCNYKSNDCIYIDQEKNCVRMHLFTNDNHYSIVAKSNYLGCTSKSRKPRAGEGWNRGNDLADGNFSKNTWNQILSDIVTYELVDIKKSICDSYTKKETI